MKSLRRTLAARFCCTMFVALTAIAAWAYLGVRHVLRDELDHTLRSAGHAEADMVAAFGSPPVHPGASDKDRFVREVNRLVVTRDSGGRIVAANTDLARTLPLDSTSLERARHGETSFATAEWLGGRVRAVYLPAPPSRSSGAVVLQVAASLDPLEAASRAVLYRIVGTVLLGALATLVGASWLAGSSVAPVAAIAAQAKAVTGGAAGERITAHADITEYGSLIEVLNEMLARLERAHHWHRRIIRDLGHDLRTPITALRAGVEVALWTERKPDEYRRLLASALEEIDRLTLISDALVLLGRLESGDLVPAFAAIDAGAVASESLARVQERVGGHRFTLTRPRGAVELQADARLLGMVLDQLLDNAMRYTPPSTTIELSVAPLGDRAELVVEDNGPGVPAETLPLLFDRFYRGDVARGRDGGPGLGLTLVAAIVALHHGMIRAERGGAGGLRIRMSLPVHQAMPLPSPAGRSAGVLA
jgi:two-component system, OmpR family, sensor kinase